MMFAFDVTCINITGATVGVIVIVAMPTGAVLVILLYRRRAKKKPLASGRLCRW